MKSLSTTIIAICLFVLCLFEKEAKQQAIEAQKLREKSVENQVVSAKSSSLSFFASQQKTRFVQGQFQLAEFVASDSLSTAAHTSESL
ncbi:MAG: hypothetical protein ABIN24_14930 [Dyadobacter sp.]